MIVCVFDSALISNTFLTKFLVFASCFCFCSFMVFVPCFCFPFYYNSCVEYHSSAFMSPSINRLRQVHPHRCLSRRSVDGISRIILSKHLVEMFCYESDGTSRLCDMLGHLYKGKNERNELKLTSKVKSIRNRD